MTRYKKNKVVNFKKERIEYWLSVGAQMSPTVTNLLITAGIIKGDKKRSVFFTKKRSAKLAKVKADAQAKVEAGAKAKADAEEAAKAKAAEPVVPTVEEPVPEAEVQA
jgi:small subunit ribosomal protein S16